MPLNYSVLAQALDTYNKEKGLRRTLAGDQDDIRLLLPYRRDGRDERLSEIDLRNVIQIINNNKTQPGSASRRVIDTLKSQIEGYIVIEQIILPRLRVREAQKLQWERYDQADIRSLLVRSLLERGYNWEHNRWGELLEEYTSLIANPATLPIISNSDVIDNMLDRSEFPYINRIKFIIELAKVNLLNLDNARYNNISTLSDIVEYLDFSRRGNDINQDRLNFFMQAIQNGSTQHVLKFLLHKKIAYGRYIDFMAANRNGHVMNMLSILRHCGILNTNNIDKIINTVRDNPHFFNSGEPLFGNLCNDLDNVFMLPMLNSNSNDRISFYQKVFEIVIALTGLTQSDLQSTRSLIVFILVVSNLTSRDESLANVLLFVNSAGNQGLQLLSYIPRTNFHIGVWNHILDLCRNASGNRDRAIHDIRNYVDHYVNNVTAFQERMATGRQTVLLPRRAAATISGSAIAFLRAARDGDLQAVRAYLSANRGNQNALNITDPATGNTALIMAAMSGRTEIVNELLYTSGINVNLANRRNFTAAREAQEHNHMDIAIRLTSESSTATNIASTSAAAAASSGLGAGSNPNQFFSRLTPDDITNAGRLDAVNFPDELIPDEYKCSMMTSIMDNPVRLPVTNTLCDLNSIEQSLLKKPVNPYNRIPMGINEVMYQDDLKDEIKAYVALVVEAVNKKREVGKQQLTLDEYKEINEAVKNLMTLRHLPNL